MLTFVQVVGLTFLCVGPLVIAGLVVHYGYKNPKTGIGKWAYKTSTFLKVPEEVMEKEKAHQREVMDQIEEAAADMPMEDQLRAAKLSQFVTRLGDRMQIVGLMMLLELQFFGSDKSKKVHIDPQGNTLREFPWISLEGDQLIAEIPSGEGKRVRWMWGIEVSDRVDAGVAEFFGVSPGHAKKFAQSNQHADIRFEVPGLDGTWKAMDIIWADCETKGSNIVRPAGGMPRIAMFLCRNISDPTQYLLFADLRDGNGSDSLWLLELLDIEVDVEEVL